MSIVDNAAEMIRANVNNFEREIARYFDWLAQDDESGWSAKCLPIIRLENDAKTLRAIADKLDERRRRLTANPHALIAAE